METLFVFLNVQLQISLRIGNLQMLLEIGLFIKIYKNNNNNNNSNNNNQLYFSRVALDSVLINSWPFPVSSPVSLLEMVRSFQ